MEREPQKDDARFAGNYDAFRKAYKAWNKQDVKQRKAAAMPILHPKPRGPVPHVAGKACTWDQSEGCWLASDGTVHVPRKRTSKARRDDESQLDDFASELDKCSFTSEGWVSDLEGLVPDLKAQYMPSFAAELDSRVVDLKAQEMPRRRGAFVADSEVAPEAVLKRKRLLALLMVDAEVHRLHDPAMRLDRQIEQSSFLEAANAAGLLNLSDSSVRNWLDDLSRGLQQYHSWYTINGVDPRREKPPEGWSGQEAYASDIAEIAHFLDPSFKLQPAEALQLSEACERRLDIMFEQGKDEWTSSTVDGCLPIEPISVQERHTLNRRLVKRAAADAAWDMLPTRAARVLLSASPWLYDLGVPAGSGAPIRLQQTVMSHLLDMSSLTDEQGCLLVELADELEA